MVMVMEMHGSISVKLIQCLEPEQAGGGGRRRKACFNVRCDERWCCFIAALRLQRVAAHHIWDSADCGIYLQVCCEPNSTLSTVLHGPCFTGEEAALWLDLWLDHTPDADSYVC